MTTNEKRVYLLEHGWTIHRGKAFMSTSNRVLTSWEHERHAPYMFTLSKAFELQRRFERLA